jgi:hypothetical protein
MEETSYCPHCDEHILNSEMTEIDGQPCCNACADEYVGNCSICGSLLFGDENYGNSSIILCESDFDSCYCHCQSCSCLLSNSDAYYLDSDDEDPYCFSCYEDRRRDEEDDETTYIHPYSYKPHVKFFGTGKRYYGIELEMSGVNGKDPDSARVLLEIANKGQDHMYIKADSSVEAGFECVSAAFSLDYHINHFNWQEVLEASIKMGYRSHLTNFCGYHIHVSREGLGETLEDQEATISRILYFFQMHFTELLNFSRRTLQNYNKWCCRYKMKDSPKEVLDNAKMSSNGRYTCVNSLNTSTIEIRIFRGSLRLNTIIAAIQLCDLICKHCMDKSDEEIQNLSWQDFVKNIDVNEMPELIEYLKIRQLYVNDKIECEEDL